MTAGLTAAGNCRVIVGRMHQRRKNEKTGSFNKKYDR